MLASADPLPPLWQRTRASLNRALALFGGVVAIAGITMLTGALRRRILARLAPLENIVRKLLLAEAARFAPHAGARKPAPTASAVATLTAAFDLSQPHTWPARFALAPPADPHAVPEYRAPRIRGLWDTPWSTPPAPMGAAPPRGEQPASAFKLARRFEALRRVVENPAPQARRLARLLARLSHRFPQIARHYAHAPARACGYDPEDDRLATAAFGVAMEAPFRFNSS